MITALSAFLGFLGALVPEFIQLWKDKRDKAHELKLLELQLQQQAQGHSERLEEIRIQGETSQMQSLYRTYYTGIDWVDALNGTVRPVLAYAFFLLYALVKLLQLSLIEAHPAMMIPILWTEEDQAIFAGIISFYFGQRAFLRRKMAGV